MAVLVRDAGDLDQLVHMPVQLGQGELDTRVIPVRRHRHGVIRLGLLRECLGLVRATIDDGALAIGGRLPTNTHGGYLSGTHAASCALFTLIELVEQLRGEAGDRQVAEAELAYACSVGGVSQAHYAAVLGRV